MKKHSLLVLLALAITACSTNMPTSNTEEYSIDQSDFVNGMTLTENLPSSPVDEKESAGLMQMREEEKLARDVYLTLGEKWNLPIFKNIASSEQTHTDTVKHLLERYSLADPVSSNEIGVFHAQIFQDLYQQLTTQGKQSLLEALTVGARIEELDIKDIDLLLAETDNQDIIRVYNNLKKGSRNHLRAYVRQILRNGGEFSPEHISEELYNSIISTPQERGSI